MLKQISIAAVLMCCAYGSTFAQLLNPAADRNASTQQLGTGTDTDFTPEAKEDVISTIIDWSADLDAVVAPNPSSGGTTIYYNTPSQTEVAMRIFTAQGSYIRSQYYAAGLTSYYISLADLNTGSYYIEVLRDNTRRTCRVVINQ